jgi:MFS family permease
MLLCLSTLACGLSKTGVQMLVFRGISGVAASFILPSAVSLIRDVYLPGKARNIAFATMGGAQPVGFGIGLVLGGFITGVIGWSWGFFVAAISNFVMPLMAAWALPPSQSVTSDVWRRLAKDMDWLGVLLASTSLALLSYVIA